MTVQRPSHRRLAPFCLLFSLLLLACVGVSHSQEASSDDLDKGEVFSGPRASSDGALDGERRLKFSFSSTPWKEVLEWIADECDLSFNLDYTPRGTLNFIDTDRLYTPTEALDEINGQLLARGYTLVRRYKTLYIVDLESEVDRKFIWDLLNDTDIKNIEKLGRFELGKVKFQLKSISTEDAEKQIENMVGPHGLAVTVPLARQVIVSETGENLRRIKSVLENVESRVGSEGLKSFRLVNATGDDVLAVAKPLLGIEMDASAAEDGSIRISTDTKGKVVYATGAPEKIALVEQIVRQVDENAQASGTDAQLTFISHKVKREDPQVVLRILETLFSGDSRVRLQTRADSILAYCTLEQHRTIEETIAEVEQEPADIDVIPLRRVDPMLAVALIERMFGADGEEPAENAPIVDARFDPNQLIINGTAAQLEQIRSLLNKLGERLTSSGLSRGPVSRVLPIDKDEMPAAIERLRQMWPTMGTGNRIRIIPQPGGGPPLIRVVPPRDDAAKKEEKKDELQPSKTDATRDAVEVHRQPKLNVDASSLDDLVNDDQENKKVVFVSHPVSQASKENGEQASDSDVDETAKQDAELPSSKTAQTSPPEIIITPTEEGLRIYSEDGVGADALEELLLQVMGNASGPKYHIFSLQHVTAEEAQTLLETLFTGGATDEDGGGADRGGAMGLFTGSSSSIGAPKMIADNRLNRLFVEGTRSQIRDVEQYLSHIDIEDGPVEVKTNPKPTYIPVVNTSAEAILEVLKSVYADRIFDPNQRNRQQGFGRGGGGFPGFGGGFGRGGGGATQQTAASTGEVSKMTLAADASSNLIIVSAPGPLVKEVAEVVRQLDSWAEMAPTEDYKIGQLQSSSSPQAVIDMLKNAYPDIIKTDGELLSTTNSSSGRTSNSTSSPFGGDAAAAAQRRAAFFQGVFGRGGGGGPGGRGGPSAFGGGRGGFGGRTGGGPTGGGGGRGSGGGRR